MDILVVSNNKHKLKELDTIITEYFPDACVYSLKDVAFSGEIEETGSTFEENALIKAKTLSGNGYVTLADDSGLMVDSLGGAPGVYSARYAGEPCNDKNNNEKLLYELEKINDTERTAKFVSVIACVLPNGESFTVRGECPGVILKEYRGNGGFGYDPLFYYEELGKTFAEFTEEEKNKVSHRARALEKFKVEFSKKIEESSHHHHHHH